MVTLSFRLCDSVAGLGPTHPPPRCTPAPSLPAHTAHHIAGAAKALSFRSLPFPSLCPGFCIKDHFMKPLLCEQSVLYHSHATAWELCRDLCFGRDGTQAQKGGIIYPEMHSCAWQFRDSNPRGLVFWEPDRPSSACPRSCEKGVEQTITSRGLGRWAICRKEPDKAWNLPSGDPASGALPPAWARLGAGAQMSVRPPLAPLGLTHVRADSGGRARAWGLAGWDPRECIHSNQLSEDWVPVGLRLLLAGAGSMEVPPPPPTPTLFMGSNNIAPTLGQCGQTPALHQPPRSSQCQVGQTGCSHTGQRAWPGRISSLFPSLGPSRLFWDTLLRKAAQTAALEAACLASNPQPLAWQCRALAKWLSLPKLYFLRP